MIVVAALAGHVGCATRAEDAVARGAGAASEVLPETLATIEAPRVAKIGGSRVALDGDDAEALDVGRRYALTLAKKDTSAEPQRDGLPVRQLVRYRPVRRLFGTLADLVSDPNAMVLSSLHEKSYVLHGDTVTTFKDIRASLPRHDYSHTLFEVNLLEERDDPRAFQWLDYAPVPLVRCTEKDVPEVHLDLVDVKPDESLLDGFVTTPITGNEARMGAHVECSRDGATYACMLDEVGTPAGTARFVPSDVRAFELVVDHPDASKTTYVCGKSDRRSLALRSED